MLIKTSDEPSIKPFLSKFYIPPAGSHKGQNGKLLIIGGSSLFHASSLWAAEAASHYVDMVHYASTKENNEIFQSLKKKFHNGIIVTQTDIDHYVKEDDAILIGPGMMREGKEGEYARNLTQHLLETYPARKFIIDAGALQMMDPEWLKVLSEPAILTPHALEFKTLFGIALDDTSSDEKARIVQEQAKKYRCVILLKIVIDIVSDGDSSFIIEGGNQGLTKGGSGDTLAGLAGAFATKNDQTTSAVMASYIVKKTADELFTTKGYFYNTGDLIVKIPQILTRIVLRLSL